MLSQLENSIDNLQKVMLLGVIHKSITFSYIIEVYHFKGHAYQNKLHNDNVWVRVDVCYRYLNFTHICRLFGTRINEYQNSVFITLSNL